MNYKGFIEKTTLYSVQSFGKLSNGEVVQTLLRFVKNKLNFSLAKSLLGYPKVEYKGFQNSEKGCTSME